MLVITLWVLFIAGSLALRSFPCWDESNTQYYAISQGTYIPTSELGTTISPFCYYSVDFQLFLKLGRDLREKSIGAVEIRKPTESDTEVYCRMLPINEDPSDKRIINRLISNFPLVDELRSITSDWPYVRVCFDTPLSKPHFPHLLPKANPVCTHATLLAVTSDKKYPIFAFTPDYLCGKRRLIDVFVQAYVEKWKCKDADYGVETVEADQLATKTEGIENRLHFQSRTATVYAPLLIDMYLSTKMYATAPMFYVFPNTSTVYMFYTESKISKLEESANMGFLEGMLISNEPFLKSDFTENFEVYPILQRAIAGEHFWVNGRDFDEDTQMSDFAIAINHGPHLARLLYIYLCLSSGPFYNKFESLEIEKLSQRTRLWFQLPSSSLKGFANFMSRIAVVLNASKSVIFGYVDGESGDMDANYLTDSFVKAVKAKMAPYQTECTRMICWDGEDEKGGLLPALINFGMIKCPLGHSGQFPLGNKDRRQLGLHSVEVPDTRINREKARRRLKKTLAKDQDQGRLNESLSGSSDDEAEYSSSMSLEDTYLEASQVLVQTKMAIAAAKQELQSIMKQCERCTEHVINQQKLVVFEFFLQIKSWLSSSVPRGSSVMKELGNPKSALRKKLRTSGLDHLAPVLRQALNELSQCRLAISKPEYRGEPLFWITSNDLRSAFVTLLSSYQPRSPVPPAEDLIEDIEAPNMPRDINMDHIKEIREQQEVSQRELETLSHKLSQARLESEKCREAYRKLEILIVGAVFKAFIDDLKDLVVTGQDIIDEAQITGSPVKTLMASKGIESVTLLKKILSFVLIHRNEVAHPSLDSLPDGLTEIRGLSILDDAKLLQKYAENLQKTFNQA